IAASSGEFYSSCPSPPHRGWEMTPSPPAAYRCADRRHRGSGLLRLRGGPGGTHAAADAGSRAAAGAYPSRGPAAERPARRNPTRGRSAGEPATSAARMSDETKPDLVVAALARIEASMAV